MKRKIFLTIAFLISLMPMIANQYGGIRGVREISGFANLMNPLGLISFLLVLAGLWIPYKNHLLLSTIGLVGIIVAEYLTFLLWPVPEYREEISFQYSFDNAFPEFWLGLATSTIMLITYVCTMNIPDAAHNERTTSTRTRTTKTTRKSRR